MAFVIFSDYLCVEAGSILSDGEDRLVYQTREEALGKYESRREFLLSAVEHEIEIINDSECLGFNSPYIVWIILLNLTECDCSLEAVDDYLTGCVEACKRPEKFLEQHVEKFDGWLFSEKGRKVLAVDQVIDEILGG